MSQKSKPENDVGKVIMKVIEDHSRGATLCDIQRYFSSERTKMPPLESIKSYLRSSVEKGALVEFNGRFKIKETPSRAKDSADEASSASQKGLVTGKDKTKETAGGAEEVAQDESSASRKGLVTGKDKMKETAGGSKDIPQDSSSAAQEERVNGKVNVKETAGGAKEVAQDENSAVQKELESEKGTIEGQDHKIEDGEDVSDDSDDIFLFESFSVQDIVNDAKEKAEKAMKILESDPDLVNVPAPDGKKEG